MPDATWTEALWLLYGMLIVALWSGGREHGGSCAVFLFGAALALHAFSALVGSRLLDLWMLAHADASGGNLAAATASWIAAAGTCLRVGRPSISLLAIAAATSGVAASLTCGAGWPTIGGVVAAGLLLALLSLRTQRFLRPFSDGLGHLFRFHGWLLYPVAFLMLLDMQHSFAWLAAFGNFMFDWGGIG